MTEISGKKILFKISSVKKMYKLVS